MVFLVTVMLLCLPFTCDPVHSVTCFFFYPAWVGEVENSTALSYNLATARCLITERERQERVCVSTCTRGSDKAEQTIGEGSQTHSTPLLCPSEEHVGRISKRTLDSSEGGDKKRTTRTHYVPVGLPFACLTFCHTSPSVGQCGWFRFDVNALQCSLSTISLVPSDALLPHSNNSWNVEHRSAKPFGN